ncbi:MAG TPA: polymorphic toxin-type HINT domain-containing protein, partial [Micromonosporaceae bacterium]
FWDQTDHTWVMAAELQPGHQLLTDNGNQATVAAIHNHSGVQNMRDLTVADVHTYYVLAGDTPVLVHNTGGSCAVGLPGDPYDPAAVAARQSEWDSLRIDLNGRAARADTPYPAPISRIDAPNTNITGSQWHAQERGQGAPGINMDGTPKDTNVLPRWPRAALDFLRKYGWNV